MYLYFDNAGNLKEIINDIPARVGASNVNTIYAYWEGLDPTYTTFFVKYVLENGTELNPPLPEEAYIIADTDNHIEMQIPFDKKRDLYFFKYGKPYYFIKFTVIDEALIGGLVNMTISYGNPIRDFEMDEVSFMVSGDPEVIQPSTRPDIAQYNNLKKLISDYVNQINTKLTPTLLDTKVVSGNNISFDYTGQKYLAILTFGNTTTLLPLYNMVSGTTYKTQGTFVYDGYEGSVKTTTINYRYNETTQKLSIWSGDSNYQFVDGYTAYLFGIKLY